MKVQSLLVCSAFCVIGAAIFAWTTWSASVVAQDDVSAAKRVRADQPAGASVFAPSDSPVQERQIVQGAVNPAGQPAVVSPFQVQQIPGTQYPVREYQLNQNPATGSPIGLPGPPHVNYYGQQNGNSAYSVRQPIATTFYPATVIDRRDSKLLELSKQYQEQQTEINKLLKKVVDSKEKDAKEALRSEIVVATSKQFDLRQQVREREIEQLKKRLNDVESTVKKRNELKEKIVEKRVADLLREPDQLSWEPVASNEVHIAGDSYPQPIIAQSTGTMTIQTDSTGQRKYVTTMPGTTGLYSARNTKRMVAETTEDLNGNKRTIMRPVEETEYVETQAAQSKDPNVAQPVDRLRSNTSEASPLNDPRFNQREASTENNRVTISRIATSSVAEAAARVKFAEAEHKRLVELGANVKQADVKVAAAELEFAKLLHARVQAEHEANTKLLELDVRQAEAECEHSILSLEDAKKALLTVANSATKSKVTDAQAAVENARIQLERAKIKFDLHKAMNRPLPTPENKPAKTKRAS